jgi:hypothetical protein
MWADRNLKNIGLLQLIFRNKVDLASFLAETLKIGVKTNNKYRNYIEELISEFRPSKLRDTFIIMNCRLLRAVVHYFEVTDSYLALKRLSHLFLVIIVDTTDLTDKELTAHSNQTD